MTPTTVDARGLSCPQPVIMVSRALDSIPEGSIEVLVTSHTARENIERLAGERGLQAETENRGEFISIRISSP